MPGSTSTPGQFLNNGHVAGGTNAGDEWSGPSADASNAWKRLDKYRRLLLSRQVRRGKQEGLDLRVHERLALQGAAPDVAVLREKCPSPCADRGQERLVVGAGIEVLREHLNGRAGAAQGFGDQPGPEVVIDQENRLRPP